MLIFGCIYLTIGLVTTIIVGLIGFITLKKARDEAEEYARKSGYVYIDDSNVDFLFNIGLIACTFVWPYILFNIIKIAKSLKED